MRKTLLKSVVVVLLVTLFSKVSAATYLSNLGNLFQHGNSIGDIHTVFASNTFVGRFSVGAGYFNLNSISLEFISFRSGTLYGPQSWNNVTVQLYAKNGNQYDLLRTLVNPRINPVPTQWPSSGLPPGTSGAYTDYIDFKPNFGITLNPFSEYLISVGAAPGGPIAAAGLLFSKSFSYHTPSDWLMGLTSSGTFDGRRTIGNLSTTPPYNEALKFAVTATLVPEPSATGIVLLGCAAIVIGRWFKERAVCQRARCCPASLQKHTSYEVWKS